MTPVEERIDHEEAIERLRFLTKHTEKFVGRECHGEVVVRCADVVALLALLTEHSAREELVQALEETLKYMERVRHGDPSLTSEEYYIVRDFARKSLPATEPAQPEEEPSDGR